jgi:hypothetical protein
VLRAVDSKLLESFGGFALSDGPRSADTERQFLTPGVWPAPECPARTADRLVLPEAIGRIYVCPSERHSRVGPYASSEICLFSDAVLQLRESYIRLSNGTHTIILLTEVAEVIEPNQPP